MNRIALILATIATAALAVLAVCAVILASPAHADDDIYLQTLRGEYFYQRYSPQVWLREGHKVCDAHMAGADDDQLTGLLQSDLGLTDTAASFVIGAAEVGLGC